MSNHKDANSGSLSHILKAMFGEKKYKHPFKGCDRLSLERDVRGHYLYHEIKLNMGPHNVL